MKRKMAQTKTNNKPVIILALALALILAIILSIYAYSKYTSSYKGASTSTVAKWSFNVYEHSCEEIDDIDFAQTIENQNNVIEKKLAPETQGKFELILDGTGSKVAIDYKIALTITEKPRNLKIYEDSEYKNEVTEQNGEFNITGSIPLEEVNTPLTKPVYWKWTYETGTTNDKIDAEDSKKSVTMTIKVTGTQRNPASLEPGVERLADVANIGDYVNYDANTGLVTPLTYTTEESVTGDSTVSTYSSSDAVKWRVLSVDKDSGKVELIAASNLSNLYLTGREGYINSENILNDIGAIYGKGKGAVGGRSVNIKDIEKYSSYDPYTYNNRNSSTGTYGGTRKYTSGGFVKGEGITGGVEDESDARLVKASSSNPVTVTQTYYNYSNPSNYFENKLAYNVLFGRNYFWLASRCVDLDFYCHFIVRCAFHNISNGNELLDNYGTIYRGGYGVVPVVSLESNISVDGKDTSGAWKLKIE